jgi:CRISPR-associated protein Csx16
LTQDLHQAPADSSERRKRLVSFLGIGHYEPTRHRLPDESLGIETKYVCRALAQFACADEIAIVATAEAEAAHGKQITDELRSANLPAPNFLTIPPGASEDDLWRQFEVVKTLLRSAGTDVAFDVTHAFRSQPFFAAAVTAFVRAVDPAPPAIRVFYAAFEARKDGVTPVWELTAFIELLDWAQNMMLFLRTGRSGPVAERTITLGQELARRWAQTKHGEPPGLAKLGKALRDFGANFETVRTGDLLLQGAGGSAAKLAAVLHDAKGGAAAVPPLADVLDRLERDLVEPLLGACDHLASEPGHGALAGLARLYLEMGRWAEAAAVPREGWITRYATPGAAFGNRNQNRPSVDEDARRKAEASWNAEERDTAREIAQVRNDIEHAGFKAQPVTPEALQRRLRNLVAQFADLPPPAAQIEAANHRPVFVNISNHPSDRWSPAQRQAALRYAPEIQDWPFPSVPATAETVTVVAIADDLVAALMREVPGVTHAMVQGEFTLVQALVRRLEGRGISCLSATTRRELIEDDGGVKTTRFEFVRFREYA